jgi:hypothetical protein
MGETERLNLIVKQRAPLAYRPVRIVEGPEGPRPAFAPFPSFSTNFSPCGQSPSTSASSTINLAPRSIAISKTSVIETLSSPNLLLYQS